MGRKGEGDGKRPWGARAPPSSRDAKRDARRDTKREGKRSRTDEPRRSRKVSHKSSSSAATPSVLDRLTSKTPTTARSHHDRTPSSHLDYSKINTSSALSPYALPKAKARTSS